MFSFARVSAAVGMRRQDYFRQGVRGWLRLHEKGGKRHDVPAHHRAEEAVEAYVRRRRPRGRAGAALPERGPCGADERTASGAAGGAGDDQAAGGGGGLPATTYCHTFRATGITAYLSERGETLEHAQRIAGHASPKTTKLYDRTAAAVSLDEIDRIVI